MTVLANALAIVGLGDSGGKVAEVQSSFDLQTTCISQSQLQAQHDSMFGPGGSGDSGDGAPPVPPPSMLEDPPLAPSTDGIGPPTATHRDR